MCDWVTKPSQNVIRELVGGLGSLPLGQHGLAPAILLLQVWVETLWLLWLTSGQGYKSPCTLRKPPTAGIPQWDAVGSCQCLCSTTEEFCWDWIINVSDRTVDQVSQTSIRSWHATQLPMNQVHQGFHYWSPKFTNFAWQQSTSTTESCCVAIFSCTPNLWMRAFSLRKAAGALVTTWVCPSPIKWQGRTSF